MAKPASAAAATVTRITETMQCLFTALRFYGNTTQFQKIGESGGLSKAKSNIFNNSELILDPNIHGGMFKGANPWKNWKKTELYKALNSMLDKCELGTKEKKAIEECYKYIQTRPDDEIGKGWWTTYIKIANKLYEEYGKGGKKYIFHRGSKWVDTLEKTRYKNWNIASGNFFTEANKWQPADIWMTTTAGLQEDFKMFCCKDGSKVKAETFMHGNSILLNHFKSKDIIPISLKKIGSSAVKIQEFNTDSRKTAKYDIEYTRASLNKRGDFWASRDVYVYFKDGGENAIQFRNFASALSAWKGELSGTTARGGKIAPEVLERTLGTDKNYGGISILPKTYKLCCPEGKNKEKTISMDKLADQKEVARLILGCKNELEESKRSSTKLTKYKKVVSRTTYKDYIEEAYVKKERDPKKGFITLAGQAFFSEEFFQDFYAYYKLLIGSGKYNVKRDKHAEMGETFMDPESFAVKLGQQPTSWIFSKYCGMVMLGVLHHATKDKREALIEQWAYYAFALNPPEGSGFRALASLFVKVY